jgi:hypothetical protein
LVYLRQRPITDARQLQSLAFAAARLPASRAQARAVEVIGMHHVSDQVVLDAMTALFATTSSPEVQAAVAGLLLRADRRAIEAPRLLAMLQRHRIPAAIGAEVVDALIRVLQPS